MLVLLEAIFNQPQRRYVWSEVRQPTRVSHLEGKEYDQRCEGRILPTVAM